ncbi:MAG: DUF998 domain-containing protein [Actinobacteria bacterium]|nr:DUF998 domain-containing protein [Actinomycetota bacterium]
MTESGASNPLPRPLVTAGVMVGPWFVGLSLIQAAVRPGFDLSKHEVSLLLVGAAGWVQVVNFVLTGLLSIAFAVGARRALNPGRGATWGPLLIGAYGVLFVIAGLFHPDPQLGFPVGAPEGVPAAQSMSSNIHSLAFSLLTLVACASCVVFARRFRADGARGRVIVSVVFAVAIVGFVAAGSALMPSGHGGLALLGAAIAITGWVSTCALFLMRSPLNEHQQDLGPSELAAGNAASLGDITWT